MVLMPARHTPVYGGGRGCFRIAAPPGRDYNFDTFRSLLGPQLPMTKFPAMPPFALTLFIAFAQLPIPTLAEPTTSAPPPAAAANAPQAPRPIPVSEIPDRLRQTAADIRAAAARTAPMPGIVEIERALPGFNDGVKELLIAIRKVLKPSVEASELHELSLAVDVTRRRLDTWETPLKNRTADLQKDIEQLASAAKSWSITRASADEAEIPAELLAQIDQTLADVNKGREAALSRRNVILALQNRLSGLRIEIDTISEEITSLVGEKRQTMFRFDAPPIWEKVNAPHPTAVVNSATARFSEPVKDVIRYYLRTVLVGIGTLAALCCLVLTGLLLLRRRAVEWKGDTDSSVRALGLFVTRPVASALLLTALGGAFIQTETPRFLAGLASLLLLWPLLRLLPWMVSSQVRPALWFLAALYAAEKVIALLPMYALGTRLAVVVICLVGAAGFAHTARILRARRAPSGWLTLSLVLLGSFAVLLAVAAVCEVSGVTTLSRYLAGAVLGTTYGAVLLFGGMLAAQGFMQVVLRSRRLGSALSLKDDQEALMGRFSRGLNFAGLAVFVPMALSQFNLKEPLQTAVNDLLSRRLSIGAVDFSLGSAAMFGIVLGSAILLSKLIRFLLSASIYSRLDLQRGSSEALSKLLHYSIVCAGFFVALGASGIELTRFTVLAGGFGVGIAFGMQTIVNNFVSGLILLFERPIHVGDNITIGSTSGQVADIGIRASTIRTWDGGDVIMPNATLISSELTNWTLSDVHRRSDLRVGAAYGSDPNHVLRILSETVQAHELVMKEPAPVVLFAGFGDSALDFIVRYWTLIDSHVNVSSDLHLAICRRFAEEGIEIPFPQRDLNLRHVDPGVLDALRPPAPDPSA